jgi:hypothetical protein
MRNATRSSTWRRWKTANEIAVCVTSRHFVERDVAAGRLVDPFDAALK